MEFEYSPKTKGLQAKLLTFMEEHVYPNEEKLHSEHEGAARWKQIPPILDELKAKARHVFVADDIAQLVVDWSIDGTGPDGKHVHVGGSAADILRRGADGLWRYIIDNNQGTAVREPA